MNIASTIKDFLIFLSFNRGLSTATCKNYHADLKLFINFLTQNKIKYFNKIEEKNISDYIKHLNHKKYSEKTIARKISSIRIFFQFLTQEKNLKKNPSTFIKNSRQSQLLPSVLSLKEVELLIKNNNQSKNNKLNDRDSTIIELLYSCGLRVSELTNIFCQDISFKTNTIKILGKRRKERIIPFGKVARNKLVNYQKTSRPKLNKKLSPILFLSTNGNPLTRQSIWAMTKKRLTSLNIDKTISPHTLRHSFATHLLNNNTSIHIIQKMLGHQNIDTTEVYTHLTTNILNKVHKHHHPRA